MGNKFAEITFTESVKAVQEKNGSRTAYTRWEEGEASHHMLGEAETSFIGARDSFYMATVSETGWPYVQHRGGPVGFVRAMDDHTLGLADFRGNRQYVSVGNLTNDNRVSLFFMDYPNQRRLKVLGHSRLIDLSDETTLEKLVVPDYKARVERGILITIDAFDWNCPQHITPRFTASEIAVATEPLHRRIAELEAEIANRPAS